MIEIQNGCIPSQLIPNGWSYTNMELGKDFRNDVKFITINFIALEGQKPEIGDFIENGLLIKRTKPKVNDDWSKWKDKDLYGNP